MRKIKLNEYEIIEDLEHGVFKVLRHGEEWRSLIGDNFVLALIDRIEELESEITFYWESEAGSSL